MQSLPPSPGPYRSFDDIPGTRQAIFDNVLAAAQKLPDVANARYSLGVRDVAYEGPEAFTPAQHKKALLRGESLGRRLRGTWVLSDPTGVELTRRRSTLATVPYLTDNGTFLFNGGDRSVSHQLRLVPGVYSREKDNGELEAHVNVAGGHASHIYLDPQSGVFRMQLGQARLPLLPLLRTMGVPDETTQKAWGPELFRVNAAKHDPTAIDKMYDKLVGGQSQDPHERIQAVLGAFQKMKLDPVSSKRTLGEARESVDADTLLATTRKLLRLNRKEDTPDDRDAAPFQSLWGPEDLFAERLQRGKSVMQNLLWRATGKGNLDHVPAGAMNDILHAVILHSGLSSNLEEINPVEILDQLTRVTRMGEGGIESVDSVPESSRSVQPTQFGFVDFVRSPESEKAGVDARLARAARKGRDGKMYTPVKNLQTGQIEYKTPQDLADEIVAFPQEMEGTSPFVGALAGGKLKIVPRETAKYQIPNAEDTFSPLGNLVPLKSAMKGQRGVMAARMLTQALALRGGEAPHVQVATPDDPDKSFEELYATHVGARRADVEGQVTAVTPDGITLKTRDGQSKEISLYNNFPYNRKAFLHQTPAVQPGQFVKPGDLLATSNYTDAKGTTALGRNLRVAEYPTGYDYEDAIVISDEAAKKLSSEHAYQHEYEWGDGTHRGKNAFLSFFPGKYERKLLDNFGADGVIKPGTLVHEGDPLILGVEERQSNQKSVLRGKSAAFKDASLTWDHAAPGKVTDVELTDKGAVVVVQAVMPMQVGDKMAGRHGNKGVVAQVLPAGQMPVDAEGNPFEVLTNPQGTISRTNPAQIIEAALGKIAAKTGQVYKIKDFSDIEDAAEFAHKELLKHGISDTETIFDPTSNRHVPDVFTGNRWYMKLHHTSESKGQGRGLGGYTAEMTPAKGGDDAAKRIGLLELHSLLSHGATNFIRDSGLVRGQANPLWWQQSMAGFRPPTPSVPYPYQKYVAQLKGSGINVVREGTKSHIMALTDKDIGELSGSRELQSAETVDWRDMSPIKGGLFDTTLTGGHATSKGGGNLWSHISLHEPLPSPVMEEPIRRLLGLTKDRFMAVLAGEEPMHGKTGPAAIKAALERINLPQAIRDARADIDSGKRTARDAAVRRLGYLKSAEAMGLHPKDWMLSKIPVLPPAFRPVALMSNNMPLVDDANHLYKAAFEANRNLKEAQGLLGDNVGEERKTLYNAFKAVVGLGDPTGTKDQERGVKGILKHVFSTSPKYSTVQRKLLGSQVDLVGRAVIAPDPDLDMDEVALPEKLAWNVYEPVLIGKLVRGGMSRLAAVRAVETRSADARKALMREMEDGIVVINRAPTLHRYGIMAARPRLTADNAMKLPPLVYGGFSCVGRIPILRNGRFEIIELSDFPRGDAVPGEPGAFYVPEGIRVLSHVPGGFTWQQPDRFYIHPDLAGCDVTIGRARTVTVSTSHSLYCFDAATGTCRRTLPEEALGKLTPRVAATAIPAAAVTTIAGPDGAEIPLTEEFGWWLGAIIGDGWVSYYKDVPSRVCLAGGLDSPLLPIWAALSASLGLGIPGKPVCRTAAVAAWGKAQRLTINSRALGVWLGPMIGRTAARKRLPDFVFGAPESFRRGVVAGLLDTDGHLKRSKKGKYPCTITTVSDTLSSQLVWLLAQLGVDALSQRRRHSRGQLAWVVAPSICDLAACPLILRMPQKREALAQLRVAPPNGKFRGKILPITAAECEELLGHYRGTPATARPPRQDSEAFHEYVSLHLAAKAGCIGRVILGKISDRLGVGALPAQLADRLRGDECWDRITAVVPVPRQDMYDLRVPNGSYTFVMANKTTVYDSADNDGDQMNFHVPATEDEKRDAEEKMLPSKNLFSAATFKAHYTPSQEYVAGLYEASARTDPRKKERHFQRVNDVLAAFARGEINIDHPIAVQQ